MQCSVGWGEGGGAHDPAFLAVQCFGTGNLLCSRAVAACSCGPFATSRLAGQAGKGAKGAKRKQDVSAGGAGAPPPPTGGDRKRQKGRGGLSQEDFHKWPPPPPSPPRPPPHTCAGCPHGSTFQGGGLSSVHAGAESDVMPLSFGKRI